MRFCNRRHHRDDENAGCQREQLGEGSSGGHSRNRRLAIWDFWDHANLCCARPCPKFDCADAFCYRLRK
jgi:hypothetical protein